jgi:hypothetical protein
MFSPVNCPFMAASYSSPNFAGPIRTDANVGKKAHYTPNSMPDYPKLRGDRETPMLLANKILSREVPTFRHDRKFSEYTRVSPYSHLALIRRFLNCIDVSWMMLQGEISIKILHLDFDGVQQSYSVGTLQGYPSITLLLKD